MIYAGFLALLCFLGLHLLTVRHRLAEYEQFKSSPLSDQDKPSSLLNQYLRKGSVYNSSNRSKPRLKDEVLDIINKCLEENTAKRLDDRAKQQLKNIDILEKIHQLGYQLSYSRLCDHISKTTQLAKKPLSVSNMHRDPVVSLIGVK